MTDPLDRTIYPIDAWRLIEQDAPAGNPAADVLFTVSNGFVGLPGGRDEDQCGPSCFVNGFYETWPLQYPETAYGLAKHGQAMQPAPNPLGVSVLVDGQPLGGQPLRQRRELDMASAIMSRQTTWLTPAGEVRVDARRLVSLTRRGLVASQFTVTPVDRGVRLSLSNGLALPEADAETCGDDPRCGSQLDHTTMVGRAWMDGERLGLAVRTLRAGIKLTVLLHHTCDGLGRSDVYSDSASTTWQVDAAAGQGVTLTVFAWYSLGDAPGGASLNEAVALGWDNLAAEQRAWLDDFWAHADVTVDDPALQQAIRWNTFQAIQASARADGLGVGAKGLSGTGYDGHYFWDMEMYALPMLTYTAPQTARAALEFRVATLPQAMARAAELHLEGALYPWRTINGEEASAYYEAGTAQYHIDADITRALVGYVAVSGDTDLLDQGGLDVLVQTARMWASLGFWGSDGAFHFHYVTGPDEYSALVNDNVYTNLMARDNLRSAASAVERAGGATAETAQWRRIADGVFIAYDEALGIHPQDAGFLELEPWDLNSIPRENFPLLLHYHPLTIYRHKVIKQADVVLAQILFPDDFTAAQKLANFDFYEPLTTGDSTLSAVPQAIAAVEVGHLDAAQQYLWKAVFVDLADLHHNTYYGIHLAVAAGVWSALVMGFGGLRDVDGQLRLSPRVPDGWGHLGFSLLWRGSQLMVDARSDQVTLSVDGPDAVELTVWGQVVVVEPGEPVVLRPSE